MKIKYSKFDFNGIDVILFIFNILYVVLIFNFSENIKEIILNSVFFSIPIIYFLYRFYFLKRFKEQTKVELNEDFLKIQGRKIKKEIKYFDIEQIIVKKNFLSSSDIMINFDETISLFRYICNYVIDISQGDNRKNCYIICQVKNREEILEKLLEKIIIYQRNRNTIDNNIKDLYIRYSLFDRNYMLFMGIFFILWVFSPSKLYSFLYLIIVNIKIFKKKYYFQKINNIMIKIFSNNDIIYTKNYYEKENKIIVDYKLKEWFTKFNFYYFTYNSFPRNYKKLVKKGI